MMPFETSWRAKTACAARSKITTSRAKGAIRPAAIPEGFSSLLEFRVYWAWLRQRSLFDRGVYGSWRAVDVGFEPLVMRRRRSRAGLYHEQGPVSCGLRARGGKPGYRGTGGQARP